MLRRSVSTVLAVMALLVVVVMACGGTERAQSRPRRTKRSLLKNPIDYEGPQTPEDTEWSLLSLKGGGAAEASDIALYHDKGEPGVEGGCLGFYIVPKSGSSESCAT